MGVMPQEIEAKISGGAWKTARPDPIEDGERRILISSLRSSCRRKGLERTGYHPLLRPRF